MAALDAESLEVRRFNKCNPDSGRSTASAAASRRPAAASNPGASGTFACPALAVLRKLRLSEGRCYFLWKLWSQGLSVKRMSSDAMSNYSAWPQWRRLSALQFL